MKYDTVIIGAGASGLMCALSAAGRGLKVAVIDHNVSPGNKILVSGNGHCNFTNLDCSHENFVSKNPHFVKSALTNFGPSDFMAMLDKNKLAYEEKESGRMFCRGTARLVVEMLANECLTAGVTFSLGAKVTSLKKADIFEVRCAGAVFTSNSLVIATGGPSFPELGASNFGAGIARQFGISTIETKPALVPLVLGGIDRKTFSILSGVSFRGQVCIGKKTFTDDIMFTHRGLSGPAILQISTFWNSDVRLQIDILPDIDIESQLLAIRNSSGKTMTKNFLSGFIRKSFAKVWCEKNNISEKLADLSNAKIRDIADRLHHWEPVISGTEGINKSHAVNGGVDTSEISSKTMETKKIKGLYFIGEVLDVVGQLGGYNLQWAWSSGAAAGRHVC